MQLYSIDGDIRLIFQLLDKQDVIEAKVNQNIVDIALLRNMINNYVDSENFALEARIRLLEYQKLDWYDLVEVEDSIEML